MGKCGGCVVVKRLGRGILVIGKNGAILIPDRELYISGGASVAKAIKEVMRAQY